MTSDWSIARFRLTFNCSIFIFTRAQKNDVCRLIQSVMLDLPVEIVVAILLWLEAKDYASLALVCHGLRTVMLDPVTLRQLYSKRKLQWRTTRVLVGTGKRPYEYEMPDLRYLTLPDPCSTFKTVKHALAVSVSTAPHRMRLWCVLNGCCSKVNDFGWKWWTTTVNISSNPTNTI